MTVHRLPRWRSVAVAALLLALSACLCAAQVELLQPEPGATLTGSLHVVARSASEDVQGMQARVADRPWVALHKAEDGTWRATLDSTLAPNGPTAVSVQQWPAGEGTSAAVDVALDNPLHWYWGDIHSHTSVSDGRMLPGNAYAYARDIARLDFFSLCDHLEKVEPAEWRETVRAATLANEDGAFAAFPGLEWTKGVGHMCVYDPAGAVWPADLAGFYTFAPANCAAAKFNHPGWRDTTFEQFAYSAEGDAGLQLMEVRNDKEMGWFITALNNGWHLAPDGSDDTHRENWGTSGTWTVVLAPALSSDNVLDALERRHCYSTRDRNCRLSFTLNGAVMGEVIEAPVTSAAIEIAVEDPDEGEAIKLIELFGDGEVVCSDEPGAATGTLAVTLTPEPGAHYYFVKVTQADGNTLYSAPIWITTPEG